MNKQELIDAIAAEAGLTKADSERALNAFLKTVEGAVAAGDKVTLVGFGTFEARKRAERQCLNPKTREWMTVPGCKVPAFSAGKAFKEKVSG